MGILNELIDTHIKNYKSDSNKLKRHTYDKADWKNPRNGSMGKVHDLDDPHVVRKVPYDPIKNIENDGYVHYIKWIVENKIAQHNPFVPRVYKFETYTDKYNRVKYKINIEKLTRLDLVDKDVLYGFLENLFGYKSEFASINPARDISNLMYANAYGSPSTNDENLNEVLKFVSKSCQSRRQFSNDIHEGNIMVRMSPYPQLVITDPIN